MLSIMSCFMFGVDPKKSGCCLNIILNSRGHGLNNTTIVIVIVILQYHSKILLTHSELTTEQYPEGVID